MQLIKLKLRNPHDIPSTKVTICHLYVVIFIEKPAFVYQQCDTFAENEDLVLLRGWLVEVWKALSVDCPFVQVCRFFLPLRFFYCCLTLCCHFLSQYSQAFDRVVNPCCSSPLTSCAPYEAGLFSFCSRMCPHLACNDTRDNDPLSQWHHLNRYVIYI